MIDTRTYNKSSEHQCKLEYRRLTMNIGAMVFDQKDKTNDCHFPFNGIQAFLCSNSNVDANGY